MREMNFEVKFLSDVILQATSNSEGKVEKLDFIPGSAFLGMTANKIYKDVSDSFAVFHSGKVRFGDAMPVYKGKATYKMPYSFFHEKLDDSVLYNHHLIDDFKPFKQLKQKRDGYITEDLEHFNIEYNYTQKSAYDKKNRRSLEGSMYGYEAIKAGTIWQFQVTCDEQFHEDAEKIKSALTGKKRLGKSKTAQYGEVEITFKDEKNIEKETEKSAGEVILYAKSRLALTDENGQPTYDLKHLCEGLSDENIVYEKCQLRIASFTPYNFKRETKDFEKVVINSGSVIVLKDITDAQLAKITNGVGAYLSEGFGEVMVNPPFLMQKSLSFAHKEEKSTPEDAMQKITSRFENPTVQFLVNRHNRKIHEMEIAEEVHRFIDRYKNSFHEKMNSQWGTIRSLCNVQDNNDIYQRVNEYISKGVAKEKWNDGKSAKLLNAIKESKDSLAFVRLLSIQMPKYTQGGNYAN